MGQRTKEFPLVSERKFSPYLFSERWPAYIYNPSRLNSALRSKAYPVAGKKHTVLYFGSRDFGFVPQSQIRTPFEDHLEEFRAQTIPKKYLAAFEKAVPEAEAELAKPKEDRLVVEKKKSGGRKSSKPKPTPKKKVSTPKGKIRP